jgi:transposase
LYKATEKYYGTEGQSSIDPVVFFKLILIGYFENLSSDRRIINTVQLRMDLLFFLGYDIDEPLPWHSTLSRTRQLYGEEVFKELFLRVLHQCADKGMVAGRRQAVDSFFTKANASMDSLAVQEVLQDGSLYAMSLQEDDEQNSSSNTINKARRSTTDHDARVSTKRGKPTQLNYLNQLSVDTAHHVITNIETHHADKRDSDCLEEVVENTVDNLKASGVEVEELLADGNYCSGSSLQYLQDAGIKGYMPNPGQYKAQREGFSYHAEEDYYQCSQGKKLLYKGTYPDSGGYLKKHYSSSVADCKNCPLKAACIKGKSKIKKLADTADKPLYDQMHQRMQTAYGKQMKKIRQSTAEPVIGTLVCYHALKKVNTIGIVQANKCSLAAAMAYNLKKLLNWTVRKTKAAAQAKLKQMENLLQALSYHIVRHRLATCTSTKNFLTPLSPLIKHH